MDIEQPEPRVGDIMTRTVVAVDRSTSLQNALGVMLSNRIHHLPIVCDSACLGMLYEVDALWELFLHQPAERDAGGCARSPAPTAPADATLSAAALALAEAGAEALVVVRDGAVAGILTTTDLIHAVAGRLREPR